MAMIQDPAGLAFLPGDQIMLDIDVSQFDMCVDLYGYYGWGVYENGSSRFGDQLDVELDDSGTPVIGATYATTPLPEVCNSAPLLPIPQIAWVGQLTDRLALGIGIVNPSVVAGMRWGGEDGTIDPSGYDDLPAAARSRGALPTPTRYQLIDQKVEAFSASAAVGYRLLPQLAVGANLNIVVLRAKSRAIQNATSGTQPSHDWLAELEAEDFFLPSITASVHTRPLRGLDLTGTFRWVDSFNGTGKAKYTTNTYQSATDATGSDPVPFENDAVKLKDIEIGLPWAMTVGVRYAGLAAGVKGLEIDEKIDPLANELWDVEFDATFNFNARSSESSARADEDITIITRRADGTGSAQTVTQQDVQDVTIDRHLEDAIALRLGGSYSISPEHVQLHAGAFYETRGIDPSYAAIDNFAHRRLGVSGGLMWRVGDFDLLAGYTHIFQETLEVAPPEHENVEDRDRQDPDVTRGFDQRVGGTFQTGRRVGGTVLADPDAPSPGDADAVARLQQDSIVQVGSARPERIVNAGKYSAAFNIISVGATYHF